jgi:bacterioferritin-associated ferredoxin
MIVCICEGISDREIRGAIGAGCQSINAIAQRCGAGTDCGQCRGSLREMLSRQKPNHQMKASTTVLTAR